MKSLSPHVLRTIVTVGLGLLLVLILGGYIYVGMYYARQSDQVTAVDEAATTTSTTRRDEILQALSNAPAPDPVKRDEVIKSLSTGPASEAVDQKRRDEILGALAQPAVAE